MLKTDKNTQFALALLFPDDEDAKTDANGMPYLSVYDRDMEAIRVLGNGKGPSLPLARLITKAPEMAAFIRDLCALYDVGSAANLTRRAPDLIDVARKLLAEVTP